MQFGAVQFHGDIHGPISHQSTSKYSLVILLLLSISGSGSLLFSSDDAVMINNHIWCLADSQSHKEQGHNHWYASQNEGCPGYALRPTRIVICVVKRERETQSFNYVGHHIFNFNSKILIKCTPK